MIKDIHKIIPSGFSQRLPRQIALAFVGQFLDIVSILVLMPVMLRILNPEFISDLSVFAFVGDLNKYPIFLALCVVLFFVLKNFISVRILKWQSDYYYQLSNALSSNLLQTFLSKDLIEVKSEKNSEMIKDIIFVPNNFVIYVLSSGIQMIFDSFLLLLILIASLFINPLGTLFLCGIAAVLIAGFYYFDRKKLAVINNTVNGKYNSNFNHLLNAVNGYVEIKTNRLEEYFVNKFHQSNGSLNNIYSELNTNRLAKPKYTETFLVMIICSLFVSSMYISNYGINALFISFLFVAAIKIIPSVNRILIGLTNIKSNLYTIGILKRAAAHQPLRQNKEMSATSIHFTEKISLSNINFHFIPSRPMLENVSLTIAKGSIIGITGASGNGKSTLVNVLTTLIAPASGNIYCDGEWIDDTNHASFLGLISYVPQAPFILEGTIRENLLLNNTVSDAEINEYLELFDLRNAIDLLPQKTDTFIGSNGYNLSGGQLQRIAMIRALLKKPEILILDEATNQLDVTMRSKILMALESISKKQNLTIITVSHQLSEMESFCDSIYELANGKLTAIQ